MKPEDLERIETQARRLEEVVEDLEARYQPHQAAAIVGTAQMACKLQVMASYIAKVSGRSGKIATEALSALFLKDLVDLLGIGFFGGRDPKIPLTEQERGAFAKAQEELLTLIDYMKVDL